MTRDFRMFSAKRVAMCCAIVVSFAVAHSALAARWYVNLTALPGGDGESWPTAFNSLDDALTHLDLAEGDEIWVAAGTYTPSQPSTLLPWISGNVFELPEEVRLYGGFAGFETSLGDRQVVDDLFVNETILTNPEGHVLLALNIGSGGDNVEGTRPMVNGFTIRECAGIAVLVYDAAPVFIRCRFIDNEREPVHASGNFDPEGANRASEFINCQFMNNTSGYKSAGVSIEYSDVVFTNCIFAGDRSSTCCGGGAVWTKDGDTQFTNCTFFRNSFLEYVPQDDKGGGGIHIVSGTVTVTNCILWENHHGPQGDIGGEDAQIFVSSGAAAVVNFTLIDGLTGNLGGQGNIDGDPLFTSVSTPNLRLLAGSPAINTGRNALVPADRFNVADDPSYNPNRPTPDLDLKSRIINGLVDMGAYEYDPEGDLAGTGSVGVDDMTALLANYGCEGECLGDFDLNEAVDDEDVARLLELMGNS